MNLLKSIPKVDKFIKHKTFENYSKKLITKLAKEKINRLREDILSEKITEFKEEDLVKNIINEYKNITKPSLQNIINATGIIVHTNLGRSLISEKSFEKVKK